jgi:hypothetical protein
MAKKKEEKALFSPKPTEKVPPTRIRADERADTEDPMVVIASGQLTRYRVRNLLFRLRDNRWIEPHYRPLAEAIKSLVEDQLTEDEYLKDFTFKWDVNPFNPLEVIRKADWYKIKRKRYPKLYQKRIFDDEVREYKEVERSGDEKKIVDQSVQVEEELRLFTRQG